MCYVQKIIHWFIHFAQIAILQRLFSVCEKNNSSSFNSWHTSEVHQNMPLITIRSQNWDPSGDHTKQVISTDATWASPEDISLMQGWYSVWASRKWSLCWATTGIVFGSNHEMDEDLKGLFWGNWCQESKPKRDDPKQRTQKQRYQVLKNWQIMSGFTLVL